MSETPHVIVIGGGINGLVASNYLRRSGLRVTLLERKERVGGACRRDSVLVDGKELVYPTGATVLGMMQDFVFKETGLADRVKIWTPNYGKMIHFPSRQEPFRISPDFQELAGELVVKLGEKGDVEGFRRDEARVVEYIRKGYRNARVPTLRSATETLGPELTKLWITGSAEQLLDHYFTADMTKTYMGMTVIESGPTSFKSPYSAFTIPLYDSGSVFDGSWGFAQGGLWALTEALGGLDQELGVKMITSTEVLEVSPHTRRVIYHDGRNEIMINGDFIVFGTDPMTAARVMGVPDMVKGTKFLGSSGKLILAFRNPVQWQDATDEPDSEAAFRFIFDADTLAELDRRSQAVAAGREDFVPGYIQLYCEGAAQRRFDSKPPFDIVVAFFKNLGFGKQGAELGDVREYVRSQILARVHNPHDLAWDHLFSPKDLQKMFFFPGGHIEHTELTAGQQVWDRTFSSDPAESFYRFGEFDRVFMCGASVYPCGSVSGTGGYMCAQEIIRKVKK